MYANAVLYLYLPVNAHVYICIYIYAGKSTCIHIQYIEIYYIKPNMII